ncbi:hypothetical protein Tco_0497930 [Tanacetum coccineum]
MDANKKFDLVNLQCPNESKILADILNNHPLRLCVAASTRVHDNYHGVKNDDLVKNIFNSRKNKEGTGMKIPGWMLTEEMKLTAHYQMHVAVFQVDVPMTQSQPIESTQGTHRTTSAPRTPNPEVTEGESSAQRKPTMIRFRVPRRPDHETPIPIVVEVDITNLEEATQISIAQRSLEDLEAQQNVEKVKEHRVDEELEQLLEGTENVDVDAFMDDVLNSQEDPDTRIETKIDKESPKAEKDADMMIINNEEEEESVGDEFELRMREKGKGIEETRDTPLTTPIRSPRTHIAPLSLDKETLQKLTITTEDAPSSVDREKL